MKKLFFLIAFLTEIAVCYAGHLSGSELYARCTSTPGVFRVTLILYRDCAGNSMCNCPGMASCTRAVNVSAADAGCSGTSIPNLTLNVVKANSGFDVVQLCPGIVSICSNCNTRVPGSSTPGIEKYTFEGDIDLSSLPVSCCRIKISYSECCRSVDLTNLASPSTQNFYLEKIIDRCLVPCNSDPVLNSDPLTIICNGQAVYYHLVATDPDGDSLSYHLGIPLSGPGSAVMYKAPYGPAVPFPHFAPPYCGTQPLGINFTGDGEMIFTPAGNFVALVAIEIKQWRRINSAMTEVGSNMREMTIYSRSCPSNFPPKFCTSDSNDMATIPPCAKHTYEVAVGQSLCFYVQAVDDASDTTDLSFDTLSYPQAAIPFRNGATFKPAYTGPRSAGPQFDKWKFCWQPGPDMVSATPWYFIAKSSDRACPTKAASSHSFAITVKAPGSIPGKSLVQGIKLFPNPAMDELNLTIENAGPRMTGALTICNIRGQELLKRKIEIENGTLNMVIDISAIPEGNYVVQLKTPEKETRIRMVKGR